MSAPTLKPDAVVQGKVLRLARAFVAKPSMFRPTLESIHVSKGHVEACDGHFAVRVETPNVEVDVLIPGAAAKSFEKAEHVTISLNGDARLSADNAELKFVPAEGPYPDCDKIWPTIQDGSVSFYMDPELLGNALKAIAAYRGRTALGAGVKITVNDPLKAILITFDGGQAIIMPTRGN